MAVFTGKNPNVTLTECLLEGSAPRGAVMVCPGGGYQFLSDREAEVVGRAFNRGGYHAFVLRYSIHNPEKNEPPLGGKVLQDLAWGIAHIRQNAEKYNLDPGKIAVCGFSAGGHAAASIGVYWNRPEFFGCDLDPALIQPNGLILSYPVISTTNSHSGSFANLAGENPADQEPYSLEKQIGPHTPPSFLWHTSADAGVPVYNSLIFCEKLEENKIPFELHIFPHGPHGMSMAVEETSENNPDLVDPRVAQWMGLAIQWLDETF